MNAIILAGGNGSRMVASKQFTHKPLLPIQGMPNIERTIIMLKDFGIEDITIISGKYANQYTFLHEKYDCKIISDPKTSASTLYAIYSVKEKIGDTFIIEGDVVLAENIFVYKTYSYYYTLKYPYCESDAWKPIIDSKGRIKSFEVGCFKEPCIFGISYWSINDAEYLRDYITHISTPENLFHSNKFWDDYFIDVLEDLPIFTYEISSESATEMNDANEYKLAIDLCYKYYLTPNKYFLNLHDYNDDIIFYENEEQSIIYTRKLWDDYNNKHPNNIHYTNTLVEFKQNEYPFMIKKRKEILGFIDLIFETKFLVLRRIYINELFRNQLLGSKILNKLITFSKLINKELRVNVYDERAVRFYKRHGFKENYVNLLLRNK